MDMFETSDFIDQVNIGASANDGTGDTIRDSMNILNQNYLRINSITLPVSGDDFNQGANVAYISDGKFIRAYPNSPAGVVSTGNLYLVDDKADGEMGQGIFSKFSGILNNTVAALMPMTSNTDKRIWLASDGSISTSPSTTDGEGVISLGSYDVSTRRLTFFAEFIKRN